jgi:hypothetical protein
VNAVEERDILQVTRGVLGYQANCVRRMAHGLGYVLKRRFPKCHEDYAGAELSLGSVVFSPVGEGLWVAHLLGQHHYNPLTNPEIDGRRAPLTDYDALGHALGRAQAFANENGVVLYLPMGLGCGDAGGVWRTVVSVIATHAPSAVLCRRP